MNADQPNLTTENVVLTGSVPATAAAAKAPIAIGGVIIDIIPK